MSTALSNHTKGPIKCTQFGRLEPDKSPTTVADGDMNVILIAAAGDASESEAGLLYSTTTSAQKDGACFEINSDKRRVSGSDGVFRNCSKQAHEFLSGPGPMNPNMNANGIINGHAHPCASEDDSCDPCPCGEEEQIDDSKWYMIEASCLFECDGSHAVDEDGNKLYHYRVIKCIDTVEPAQRYRSGSTAANNRVDLNMTFAENPNFGYGPGDIFLGEMEDTPCPVVEFTSTVCPPCTGCACGSDWSGCFVTQAMIDDGLSPRPLGDECELTVIMTGTNTAFWTNPFAGTDVLGSVCTKVTATDPTSNLVVGLSANPGSPTVWADFGFYELHIGNADILQVRENGVLQWSGSVVAGDTYCVFKSATGAVTYELNGAVIYTSTQTATGDCFLDGNSYGYGDLGDSIMEVSACP